MGVAAVAAVGASITGAEARIPGLGNGLPVTTDAPDLRSATIVDLDLKAVNFCYDQPLNGTPVASRYLIQTYDANRFLQGVAATIAANTNQLCARVTFPATADLRQGTIATDTSGGVQDAEGRRSTIGTEPLTGSTVTPVAGRTTAPDLLSGAVDSNAVPGGAGGSITYTFDETIDAALAPVAGQFRFYDEAGTVRVGAVVVSRTETSVRVGFAQPVSTAVRAFTLAGAVRDSPQSGNVVAGRPTTTPSGADAVALARTTNRPVISAVSGGPRQFTVTYNQDVNTGAAASLAAVLDDGATVTATNVEFIPNAPNTQVRATFGTDIGKEASAVVRLVDLGGAVVSRDTNPQGSAVSASNAGAANSRPGFTNAPDLLSVSRSGTQVLFRYDEDVQEGLASAFLTAVAGGTANFAGGSVVENGATVTVDAGNAASNSVGAGNIFGSVRDGANHLSPYSLISYAVEQAPAPPPPPTPTGTPPPPPTPRAKFRSTISLKVRSRTRYSGRVSSSGPGCKSRRRVVLKRNGKSIRSTSTRSNGTFSLARSKGTRGKKGVYAVVTQKSTSTTICTSKASKKLRRG